MCTSYILSWLLELCSIFWSQEGWFFQPYSSFSTFLWLFRVFFQFISSVKLFSPVWLFVTPCTTAHQTSLSTTNSWSLNKLMSIVSVTPPNRLILCRPLLLLPPIAPSIRVFSNQPALAIRWPKYWRFTFNISPSKEHSGLISFRMDCLDLLAVQGILKSLLQHHISKASIIRHSAFFILQLSIHYYWKNHSLD